MKRSHRDILLICAAVWLLAAGLSRFGWLEALEMKTVDLRFRIRHFVWQRMDGVPVSGQVVLLGVDERSVDPTVSLNADRWGVGGWLTRDHWIHALDPIVNHFKPKVVAYDIIFQPFRKPKKSEKEDDAAIVDAYLMKGTEPFSKKVNNGDIPSVKLLNVLDEACNTTMAARFFDIEDSRADGKTMPRFLTACALTSTNADHATAWVATTDSDKSKLERLAPRTIAEDCFGKIPDHHVFFQNATLPFDVLLDSPIGMASINVMRDEDGILRRLPLVVGYRDPLQKDGPRFVPSLALMSCLLYMGFDPDPAKWTGVPGAKHGLKVEFGKDVHIWTPEREIRIPVDDQGRMFLNFSGEIADYPNVPYVAVADYGEVLDKEGSLTSAQREIPRIKEQLQIAHNYEKELQGKIALVGLTFTGGTDVGPCALDPNTPLVFIHMTAIDNILRGSFARPTGPVGSMAFLAFLLGITGWINTHRSAGVSARSTVVLLLTMMAAGTALFFANITILPIVVPTLSILVAFGAISIYRYEVEQKGRIEIRKKFSAMVSGRMLQYMEEHPEKLSGERREATMFFSDVAGFTTMSEKLSPDSLSKILNDYLSPMTNLIMAHDGYVNKFAGDGIMAVWGVLCPPDANHASQACFAAIEQQEQIKKLKPIFRQEYGMDLKVRMGLNTGIISAGNMGSKTRYEYTVMGDAVNFAARLEPSNKVYGTLILIGAQTYAEAKDMVVARRLDLLEVTGKTEPVEVFELVGVKGVVPEETLRGLARFEEGLALYRKQEWKKAIEVFQDVMKILPDDPPSKVFIQRSTEFQKNPPPDGWKGEYKRTAKD